MKKFIVELFQKYHAQEDYTNLTILEHVSMYLDDDISEKEAIKIVARERNIAKSIVYREYHNSKEEKR